MTLTTADVNLSFVPPTFASMLDSTPAKKSPPDSWIEGVDYFSFDLERVDRLLNKTRSEFERRECDKHERMCVVNKLPKSKPNLDKNMVGEYVDYGVHSAWTMWAEAIRYAFTVKD